MSSQGNNSVGIIGLAVQFPNTIRTNDYFLQRCPEVLAEAEKKSLNKVWSPHATEQPVDHFNDAMAPYLSDPFRGTVERRVVGPEEGSVSLERGAIEQLLAACKMTTDDVDLLISSSLLPDSAGTGNAAFLAQQLSLRGSAFNVESACSGSLVGLQTAYALVQSGQYRNVVVSVSCTYSRAADETDSLGWTCGDGAAAYLVGPVAEGYGMLGTRMVHTGSTCGAIGYEFWDANKDGRHIRLYATPKAGKLLKQVSETSLRTSCEGAAKMAGVSLSEIDFFVCNTPLAWYTEFCARALNLPREKTINTYPLYANTGPVLMPTNLFHAAKDGRIKKGDLVLVYTIGSVSSAGAAVMRWGDAFLGPLPARPS